MAKYRIEFKKSAVKELKQLPSGDLKRIITRIDALADDPRPPGCCKLSGDEKYRIPQGRYRILYEVHDDVLIVIVVKIGHRKEVYR